MEEIILPPKFTRALAEVTNETRPDVALEMIIKDYAKMRLNGSIEKIKDFEKKWGMEFDEFKEKCKSNSLPDEKDPYSWEVEKDYRDWESFITLKSHYEEILERWAI